MSYAALLVCGFSPKLEVFADFLYNFINPARRPLYRECMDYGVSKMRCLGGGCAQRPVLRVNESKKTDARRTRAISAAKTLVH